MKQARVLIQSGQLVQQAYPWEVLSGQVGTSFLFSCPRLQKSNVYFYSQLPPNQFASRLKSLEIILSQFSTSLPYPNITQNNKRRKPPFITILLATLLTFVVLLFVRNGANATFIWTFGGIILGVASYLGVRRGMECLRRRKVRFSCM